MRIGIDLGGTKIEIIALAENGEEQLRLRVPTPQGDYPATLQAIGDLVHLVETRTRQTGSIGIGIPGAISPTSGLVKNANSTWLIGKPLQQDLERLLDRPVRLANDANCFTISEATDGAGQHANVVFGVIVGTGTGGGISVQGKILEGINAIGGEWGHNPLPWPKQTELPGNNCYCGRQGCIETWLSGPAFARQFDARSGINTQPENIVKLATQGNEVAEQTLQDYEDRMARSLASVINLLDPDVIVLGGGMSNIQRLYHNVPRLWNKYVFSDNTQTQLLNNLHGDSSGVRGAAWLWP